MGMSGKDYLKEMNERKERSKKKDPMRIFTKKASKQTKKSKY